MQLLLVKPKLNREQGVVTQNSIEISYVLVHSCLKKVIVNFAVKF